MLCRVLWVVCVLTAAVASCAAVAMPTLDTVTIASNTAHPTLATIGDLIIVSFTSSEPIQSVSVTISGSEATIDSGPRSWTAEYRMQPGDAETVIPFTIDFAAVSDGSWGMQVGAITEGSPVTFDRTPPIVSVPDLAAESDSGHWDNDDTTNDSTPAFGGTIGAVEGGSTVNLYGDEATLLGTTTAEADGSWSITSPVIPDGTHNVTITATDEAGNVSLPSDSLSVLIDTQAPNDPRDRLPLDNAWINTTSPVFSWAEPSNPFGSSIYNYRIQIWGPVTRSRYTTLLSYSPTLGAEGIYTWKLYSLDVAGNTNSTNASTWTLNIDATSPVISNVVITNDSAATNDYVKDGDNVTITATVEDSNLLAPEDAAYIEADLSDLGAGTAVNPSSYVGTTATWTLVGVACSPRNGTVTVTVDADDRAGNAATQGSDTIISDNILPAIDNVAITNTTISTTSCVQDGQNVTISARVLDVNLQPDLGAGEDSTRIFADLSSLGGGSAVIADSYVTTSQGATATWTLEDIACSPPNGSVTITVDAIDRAGNEAIQGSDSITSDNDAPRVTSIASASDNGCYSSGDEIDITIHFSEDVTLAGGSLTIDLDSGGFVEILPFESSNRAQGTYTVLPGHDDCDLSVTSLALADGATLRDCPWNEASLSLPQTGNNDLLEEVKQIIVDTTDPIISGVDIEGDGLWLTSETVSSDCCTVTLGFEAQMIDNCSIPYDRVNVTWTYGAGSALAVIENLTWWREPGQTDLNLITILGTVDVRCLTGCPVVIVLTVAATDCSGNAASPLVSDNQTMGRVNDVNLPEPRDDPHGDEDRRSGDGLEVRLDNHGKYRLMVRESTPVWIDVVYNDRDNCSSCTCCGTMWIHDIATPPEHGITEIMVDNGDCNGGTSIRYDPYQGYIGPDSFTYEIEDACGNVSQAVTVYVEVVRQTAMEDLYLTTCGGKAISFDVTAKDLWIDPDNPDEIPFTFSIVSPPMHGVLSGDLGAVTYAAHGLSTETIESAAITLTYLPATGFAGRDTLSLKISDPFGGSSTALVDIVVTSCTEPSEEPRPIALEQGEVLQLIVPLTFAVVHESARETVTLIAEADGMRYPGTLSVLQDELIGRHILNLETALLPPGLYRMAIPLGNGGTVELMIEVGEAP